jgi:peptidoglycan hydrolase-like protein with peptidoglycan-binding domain/DNA invertase Pin-like site-specific DNA recombinase
MQRTYRVPRARAGLVGLAAIALLLACPGTSIAGGTSKPTGGAATLSGGPLQRGAGYGTAGGSDRVRALQRALRSLEWRPGRVDGLFGPRTQGAVVRLQQAAGLAADGIVGRQTRQAIHAARQHVLRRGAGYAQAGGALRVRRLQRELRRRGLRPGPVDGRFGPRTEAAVARLQKAVRLPADGVVNADTRRVLARVDGAAPGIPTSPARGGSQPRKLRVLAAQLPNQADEAATVPVTLAGALVLVALLMGALVAWLLARPHALAGVPVPLASGVPAEAPRGQAVPAPEPVVEGVRALGYVSVPNADRRDDARLRKQAGRIDALCEERGWLLVETVRDVEGDNGKGLDRPGLQYALERIAQGEASCLVVSHLGRLTRSAGDLGRILERLRVEGARLVAIDVGLDTGSHDGDIAADALMAVGIWERRRVGERTRKGLAAARARGAASGRPAVRDLPALQERIVAMRSAGMTLQAIADRLNEEGIPTLRGGKQWRPSSVQAATGYRRPNGARGQASSRERSEDEP